MCSPALTGTGIISAFHSFAFISFHLPVLHYSVLISTVIYIYIIFAHSTRTVCSHMTELHSLSNRTTHLVFLNLLCIEVASPKFE